jgi:hypothetical protein
MSATSAELTRESTAAAIDRVVHHAVVLEFTRRSARAEVAEERAARTKRPPETELLAPLASDCAYR